MLSQKDMENCNYDNASDKPAYANDKNLQKNGCNHFVG